jgi:hypothetical protein
LIKLDSESKYIKCVIKLFGTEKGGLLMAESDKAVSNGKRSFKTKSPHLLLQPGSLAVRTTPKQTWKQKYKDLEEEYRSLKEKLKDYEDERNRCNKVCTLSFLIKVSELNYA